METQAMRRRINTIAGHFAIDDDISAAATHVLPVSCSGGLNSVIRRYDNKTYFARQGSGSQACFMRQASTDQEASMPLKSDGSASEVSHSASDSYNGGLKSVIRRADNMVYFARQGSSSQACFMRQALTDQEESMPLKSGGLASKGSHSASDVPLFSIPSKVEPRLKSCAPEPPMFARPNGGIGRQQQSHPMKKLHTFESSGFKWSPRMDVVETGCSYILTLELPGVSTDDVRVEVGEKMLTVTGRKSIQWSKLASLNTNVSEYHRREISQGPYQVAWPLPSNVNKDCVSAELV